MEPASMLWRCPSNNGPSRFRCGASCLKLLTRAHWKYRLGLVENLAGAEGFEPSPSSLTVRCPTSWTTPQRARPQGGRLCSIRKEDSAAKERRRDSSKIARARISPNEV